MKIENIPSELRALPQWVNWKTEIRNGKPTKVPLNPKTLKNAMSNNSDTWKSFESAISNYNDDRGIGFVTTTSDPYTGGDIDKCRNPQSGEIESWAMDLIQKINSYTEVSPSGTGIRFFVKAKLPEGSRKMGRVEFYDSGRFFTVTGQIINGFENIREWDGEEIYEVLKVEAKDRVVLDKAIASANGEKFKALWNGDWSGYSSQSEADMALVSILYFHTKDKEWTDRLFRKSGLFRPKWDEKHFADGRTYGQKLIEEVSRGDNNKSSSEDTGRNGCHYFIDDEGNLCKWKQTREGAIPQTLANFEARIIEELIEDNGLETIYFYGIEGTCRRKILSKINIPANSFNSMTWLPQWGSQVIIEPGQAIKDYVRHSIQVRSDGIKREVCYTHTGWRKIKNEWCYLSASGALGAENVSVRLSKELQRYSLPLQPENESQAIKTSLSFLGLASKQVTLPLLCFTYLSPLTTLITPMPNFSAYLHGPTGVFKTELAKLCVGHFGSFNEVIGLSSFEDTPNSIEKRSFDLKDTLHVLDDYHPSYRRIDAQQKESLAQRIIRGYSNRSGRHRLKSDATERGAYIPRGLLMITGEELPSLQSTNARICVIEIPEGDINIEKLSEIQAKAHLLPFAMSSFLLWIKNRIEEVKKAFSSNFSILREKAYKEGTHLKLPEQTAFLQFTLDLLLSWLIEKDIYSETEAKEMSRDGWDTFCQLAEKQSKRIEREDPVKRFVEILQTLITQGRVKLYDKESPGGFSGGMDADLIGFFDEIYLYLLPSATWHIIQRFCISEGSHFPFSRQTFYRLLTGRGLIETDRDHSTKTEWINGKSQKVLKIIRSKAGLENL